MILGALSLWKKLNPQPTEWETGDFCFLPSGQKAYKMRANGRNAQDGFVRIFGYFARPDGEDDCPAVLLLPDVLTTEKELFELFDYYLSRGYAVFAPDYKGKQDGKKDYTEYPPSLAYANYQSDEQLLHVGESAENTCWFEWTYVALYGLEFLKSRTGITSVGIVGVKVGGEIGWKASLSSDASCFIAVNAVGWTTYRDTDKFSELAETNMSDERHRYIAGIESQSYAPFVACPVLMLCSLREKDCDYDRAYDTFSRLANKEGSAIFFSTDSGACIGPSGLKDMDLFLEKYLKGREIYIPDPLSLTVEDLEDGALSVCATGGEDGIVEKAGIYYSETGKETDSHFRYWQRIAVAEGKALEGGELKTTVMPYAGADYVFIYAYAKYLNGFKIVSRIAGKRREQPSRQGVPSRMLYSEKQSGGFCIEDFGSYAHGGIFLESFATPKSVEGYGGIKGAYSVGGIRTYKISSPQFMAGKGALLEFDAYARSDVKILSSVDVANGDGENKKYVAEATVRAGGKWKRVIFSPADYKDETGAMLPEFSIGKALSFDVEEDEEFLITNLHWL